MSQSRKALTHFFIFTSRRYFMEYEIIVARKYVIMLLWCFEVFSNGVLKLRGAWLVQQHNGILISKFNTIF